MITLAAVSNGTIEDRTLPWNQMKLQFTTGKINSLWRCHCRICNKFYCDYNFIVQKQGGAHVCVCFQVWLLSVQSNLMLTRRIACHSVIFQRANEGPLFGSSSLNNIHPCSLWGDPPRQSWLIHEEKGWNFRLVTVSKHIVWPWSVLQFCGWYIVSGEAALARACCLNLVYLLRTVVNKP